MAETHLEYRARMFRLAAESASAAALQAAETGDIQRLIDLDQAAQFLESRALELTASAAAEKALS